MKRTWAFIAMPEGNKNNGVRKGYLTEHNGVKLFLHNELEHLYKGWACSSYKCGFALSKNCDTRKEALNMAIYVIDTIGAEKVDSESEKHPVINN